MAIESSRGVLIAILVLSIGNLVVGVVQTGLLLKQSATVARLESGDRLPAKFDAAALAKIASRVTEPYNRGDLDALYNVLDDVARAQVSRAQFDSQVKSMVEVIGKVDSAAYVSARSLPHQGGPDAYELKYVVKLSGTRFSSGEMTVNIFDRTPQAGIFGFFINGKVQ
jgi:hypothetical protein